MNMLFMLFFGGIPEVWILAGIASHASFHPTTILG
jgi:hypothetical protein